MFAVVTLVLGGWLPRIFTSDPEVLARARELWPVFALMQPLNAAAFALDGIRIERRRRAPPDVVDAGGDGDGHRHRLGRFGHDWGIVGVWFAILALILVRLVTLSARFARKRRLVGGWA